VDVNKTIDTFITFFRELDHQQIPSSSLVPPPGDSVLFTTSGMHPLTPYIEGRPHPLGRRLTGLQRCLRTTDLDETGDYSHLTVFQMLGSWSLRDYSGPQSLRWGHQLLTGGLGVRPGLLYATVFGGDGQVGPDVDSQRTWTELGVPVELTTGDENWWSNGPTGPCGPDSEIFVWTGEQPPSGSPGTDDRWVELWNHVTMRYRRLEDGSLIPLQQPSVDTGMGLERLLMVLQGKQSVFETDIFQPWRDELPGLWQLDERTLRITSDHLRAGIAIIGDGVLPSNTGRGYVLRRLLRRALTLLWRDDSSRSVGDLPSMLIEHTLDRFGQGTELSLVRDVLGGEQRKFGDLLVRGRKVLSQLTSPSQLTETDLRYLHETHGLPPELVTELLSGQEVTIEG
jgi:alanyl-tRNA synthetase